MHTLLKFLGLVPGTTASSATSFAVSSGMFPSGGTLGEFAAFGESLYYLSGSLTTYSSTTNRQIIGSISLSPSWNLLFETSTPVFNSSLYFSEASEPGKVGVTGPQLHLNPSSSFGATEQAQVTAFLGSFSTASRIRVYIGLPNTAGNQVRDLIYETDGDVTALNAIGFVAYTGNTLAAFPEGSFNQTGGFPNGTPIRVEFYATGGAQGVSLVSPDDYGSFTSPTGSEDYGTFTAPQTDTDYGSF